MRTGKKRNVQIYSPCKALKLDPPAIQALFRHLDTTGTSEIPPGELSLAFLEDEAHRRLHQDYLNDPTPTDVITFPGDPDAGLAGEICVSIDTARDYAQVHAVDFSRELTLYLVHGWLHLAGFDDRNEKDRQTMKKQEQVCLDSLETHGKIPIFNYKVDAR